VQSFQRVVRGGRLGHAYFFAGPHGVGKRLFAEELAKSLLCEARPAEQLEACDQCPGCLHVAAGTHPDFFIARRPEDKHEFPIELMREFCRNLSLKSVRSRGKVAILDDADDLNEESANCFLKTLEEPPPGSVLLLIGTSTDLQYPTIISRCQTVAFGPLPAPLVCDILREQGVEDPLVIERLARMSGGSPGQALALADPALWEFRRAMIQSLVQPRFDSVAASQSWMQFIEEAGKDSAAQRRRAALLLHFLIEFLNTALALLCGDTPKLAESEDLRALQTFVQRTNVEQLFSLLERCLEADVQLERRVQLVLVIEGLLDALGRRMTN
jgi:DNA polymerase-3 subunit delta'